MSENRKNKRGVMTRVLHSGWRSDPVTGAFGLPIYPTAGYEFQSASHAAELFALETAGHIYSRLSNPTVSAFEETLADMEGGVAAVATSSGQAALSLLVMTLASPGDHIVVSRTSYGGTLTLLKNLLGRYGLEIEALDFNHPCCVQNAIKENTRAILCEAIGNPVMNVAPLESLAGLARRSGVPFIVDNTFSPVLCSPLDWGADVVLYSTTKYISGLGHVLEGAIVDGGRFDWSADDRWASLNRPDPAYHGVVFTERFGASALSAKIRTSLMRDLGACPSPFDSYLLRQSLATLPLRMKRHSENAQTIAEFLENHPAVSSVSYPGLSSHPQHDLARQYLVGGFSGMISCELAGGYEAGVRFLENTGLFAHVANVGDARSMAIHSASTTHSQLTAEERAAAGIGEGMIRLSVGLEDVEDLVADLKDAL